DAGRGNLEMIFAVDRILDVEHGREILAQTLAIGDGKAAVLVLGHDLQRAAIVLRDLHADQRIAEVVGDRLDDPRDARLEAGFLDVAFFVQIESQTVLSLVWAAARVNGSHLARRKQKERGPVRAPTLK